MKNLFLLLLTSTLVSSTACAQKPGISKVPVNVKESFARLFPGVKAKWEMEDGKYEADFKQNGHEMSAVFEATYSLAESETAIPLSELPAAVKSYIKTHYNGVSVKEAATITTAAGKTAYEAAIKGKDIIFDADGNFIKEVSN